MDLYIDKSNLISMIRSNANELYSDCIKLLKKQLNVYFNFSKEELRSDPSLMMWYTSLSQGVGESNTFVFGYQFPVKPIKSNSSNSFNSKQLSSIYLLADEGTEKIKNTGSVLVGGLGEEISIINKLFLNQKDYLFEKKWRIGGEHFKKWKDLEPYSMPLTEIIIIDPYIIHSIDSCKDNLFPFIETLCATSLTKINVVIYTDREKSVAYEVISPLIRKAIKSVTGIGPNLTLVTYTSMRGLKSIAEHDRTILMNYCRVFSGDTFNYFDKDNNVITKGREIHYSSLAKKENHLLFLETIDDLQSNIEFLESNNSGIEGDKKSGFIKFNN